MASTGFTVASLAAGGLTPPAPVSAAVFFDQKVKALLAQENGEERFGPGGRSIFHFQIESWLQVPQVLKLLKEGKEVRLHFPAINHYPPAFVASKTVADEQREIHAFLSKNGDVALKSAWTEALDKCKQSILYRVATPAKKPDCLRVPPSPPARMKTTNFQVHHVVDVNGLTPCAQPDLIAKLGAPNSSPGVTFDLSHVSQADLEHAADQIHAVAAASSPNYANFRVWATLNGMLAELSLDDFLQRYPKTSPPQSLPAPRKDWLDWTFGPVNELGDLMFGWIPFLRD